VKRSVLVIALMFNLFVFGLADNSDLTKMLILEGIHAGAKMLENPGKIVLVEIDNGAMIKVWNEKCTNESDRWITFNNMQGAVKFIYQIKSIRHKTIMFSFNGDLKYKDMYNVLNDIHKMKYQKNLVFVYQERSQ
jgi:hypothetical protein